MPIESMDLVKVAHENKKRTNIINTSRFHAVLLYYRPGQEDELHCHNQDQTFYVIEGQCTMRFPDGGQMVLDPGMLVTITGGSFYQLQNSGPDALVMLLNRSGSQQETKKIDYVTRKEIVYS